MRNKLTVFLLACFIAFTTQAQVYINDNFSSSGLSGWTFGENCNSGGQYQGVWDGTNGNPAGSIELDKTNCGSPCSGSYSCYLYKTVAISPSAIQFTFSLDYLETSNFSASTVTNALVAIYDSTNHTWVLPQTCLVCGGTTNTGWVHYSNTFTLPCPGTNMLTIYLYSEDHWPATPWCRADWFDNIYLDVTNTCVVLPVTFLFLRAAYTPAEEAVNLNWATATETNNKEFAVEKSENGISWHTLTIVAGAGNSTRTLYYNAQDAHPYSGVSYYRIKQSDDDGSYTYSDIVPVTTPASLGASIFPNPAGAEITLTCYAANVGAVTAIISNLSGKTMLCYTFSQIQKGANTFKLPVTTLSKGMYFIKINTPEKSYYFKFVKE